MSIRLPEPGELVGDYRIVKRLGDGGFGTVFQAERAGGFYAVKFLHGALLEPWARREVSVLLHLEHPNVVRFVGCDRWPNPSGASYIVMNFVEGRTLETYAEEENPSARRCARIMLDIALTLAEVHRQGVFHRDLKPENVIIHDVNARPILVDFGVGSLVGARTVTRSGAPPGTFEFRSPESWLFSRENEGKDVRYEYGVADELWALGVTFFWLLTDLLPFGERREPGLVDRILTHSPKAPRLINARVPRALSEICMRMLEKDPAARYGSMVEFCAAMDAAMVEAELDGTWDIPLIDPDAPDRKPTINEPAMADASLRWLGEWRQERPRRGQKKVAEVAAAPVAAVAEVPLRQTPAPARAAPLPVPAPGPPRGAKLFPASVGFFPFEAMVLDMLKGPALLVALLVIILGAGVLVKRAEPVPASAPEVEVRTTSPLPRFTEATATWHAGVVHELEIPWRPSESPAGGGGAVPAPGTSTSAPTMSTMGQKIDSSLKSDEKPAPKRKRSIQSLMKKCVGAACCATLSGCPAPQVRPTPQPEACPPGAVEAMKELGIALGAENSVTFPAERPPKFITVEEGFTSVRLFTPWKELPYNTVFRGRLLIGSERVFGRFTEAETPTGTSYPVCLELREPTDRRRGVVREDDGGPDRARIFSTVDVRAVDRFE